MTDDADTVAVCPKCDTPSVATVVGNGLFVDPDHDNEHRCSSCGATFDEPDYRPPKDSPIGDSETSDGLPSALSAAAKDTLRELREDV